MCASVYHMRPGSTYWKDGECTSEQVHGVLACMCVVWLGNDRRPSNWTRCGSLVRHVCVLAWRCQAVVELDATANEGAEYCKHVMRVCVLCSLVLHCGIFHMGDQVTIVWRRRHSVAPRRQYIHSQLRQPVIFAYEWYVEALPFGIPIQIEHALDDEAIVLALYFNRDGIFFFFWHVVSRSYGKCLGSLPFLVERRWSEDVKIVLIQLSTSPNYWYECLIGKGRYVCTKSIWWEVQVEQQRYVQCIEIMSRVGVDQSCFGHLRDRIGKGHMCPRVLRG
mgnify:CR=1 FL=1